MSRVYDIIQSSSNLNYVEAKPEVSFVDMINGTKATTKLEFVSPKSEQPGKIKINLLEHQLTIIRAVLDLEEKRKINFMGVTRFVDYCRITSPGGTGKTLMVLSIIAARPQPSIYPKCVQKNGVNFTIKKKYLLRPSVIYVGTAVFDQYRQEILRFTELKPFSVTNVHNFISLVNAVKTGAINNYDIILVRNATITPSAVNHIIKSGINIPQVYKPKDGAILSMMQAMRAVLCHHMVPWQFLDDYDMTSPKNVSYLPELDALFTVYVSATHAASNHSIPMESIKEDNDFIRQQIEYETRNIHRESMFDCLNICNSDKFNDMFEYMPKIFYNISTFAKKGESFMNALSNIKAENIKEIMTMINSDSLVTAAKTVGIEVGGGIGGIFEQILRDNYRDFLKYKSAQKRMLEFKKHLANGAHALENMEPEQRQKVEPIYYSSECFDEIKAKLMANQNPTGLAKYPNKELLFFLDGVGAEIKALLADSEMNINRMRSNLKVGQCPICCIPFGDVDIGVTKCCGITICHLCFRKGLRLQKNEFVDPPKITGTCTNCSRKINFPQDIVVISREINLKGIVMPDVDKLQEEEATKNKGPEEEPDTFAEEFPKIAALIKIINGQPIKATISDKNIIPYVLPGKKDIPKTAEIPTKVLVFSNYDESIENIHKLVAERTKVNIYKLLGTYKQISNIVEQFRADPGPAMMIVNAQKHCAGLNLQFVSDLVFIHAIPDIKVETQLASRADRIGRVCNLQIHYLLYKNESAFITGRL